MPPLSTSYSSGVSPPLPRLSLPRYPFVSYPGPPRRTPLVSLTCPSAPPSPQTEIMRNEFERLAARQPLELLSMKR